MWTWLVVVGCLFVFGLGGFLLARSFHRFRERQRAEWARITRDYELWKEGRKQ
jgi:hypothetical protein